MRGFAESALYASQTQLPCARGDVWAGIAVTADTASSVAAYEIRITNNSEIPLRARFRGAPAAADADIDVGEFSIFETNIPVAMASREASPPACIDVEGDGLAFSLNVPSLSLPPRDRSPAVQVALVICVLLFAITAAALA